MHSSSRYLDTSAANSVHQSSALQQPQPCTETHTDVCVDAEGRQTDEIDAVKSQATQGGHIARLEESSTACLPTSDASRITFDPECRDCQLSFQYTKPDRLVMYLHAYRYQVRFCDTNTKISV